MMPLVRAKGADDAERLRNRIAHTRQLLTVAAVIMSGYLVTTSFITTVLVPPAEFAAGRPGQRPGARLPGARAAGQRLRHRLRHQLDPDPLVRRRLRDGRPDQHRAALPARLRDGAGVGARGAAGGAGLHGDRHRDHDPVPGRCGRPGGGVRHRHPGHDGVRGVRGDRGRPAPPPAARRVRVRRGHRAVLLRAGRQHRREAGRHRHLAGLHRRHRGHLADLPASARTTELRADAHRVRRAGQGVHVRLHRPRRAALRGQQAPGR